MKQISLEQQAYGAATYLFTGTLASATPEVDSEGAPSPGSAMSLITLDGGTPVPGGTDYTGYLMIPNVRWQGYKFYKFKVVSQLDQERLVIGAGDLTGYVPVLFRAGDTGAVVLGRHIRAEINTPNSGRRPVRFLGRTRLQTVMRRARACVRCATRRRRTRRRGILGIGSTATTTIITPGNRVRTVTAIATGSPTTGAERGAPHATVMMLDTNMRKISLARGEGRFRATRRIRKRIWMIRRDRELTATTAMIAMISRISNPEQMPTVTVFMI